jgi:hypothetical protein
MSSRRPGFVICELQWLKLHLRLAAHEQSGSRLRYRFDFSVEPDVDVTCDIYYIDDELNSMKQTSQPERIEIYEGRIEFGMHISRRALNLAELPHDFVWTPKLQFVLHEECGMGGTIVHTEKRSFSWPENPPDN